MPIKLQLEGATGEIKIVGEPQLLLKGEAINEFTFFVEIPKNTLTKRSSDIKIAVYQGDTKIQTVKTKFLGPFL